MSGDSQRYISLTRMKPPTVITNEMYSFALRVMSNFVCERVGGKADTAAETDLVHPSYLSAGWGRTDSAGVEWCVQGVRSGRSLTVAALKTGQSNMFEHYSEESRRVIFFARYEAACL